MPINIQRSNGLLKPVEDMGFSLEFRKSGSKQHSSSKTATESSVLPHSKQSSKDADKLKSKSGVGPQCRDLKQKGKLDSEGKTSSCETARKGATESDELVKHMSNLPGYLLHNDRVENLQEKAFNVGVLDWSRLEKWKHKHKNIPVLPSNFTLFNSSGPSSRTAMKPSTSVGSKEKLNDKRSFPSSSIRPSYRNPLPESAKLPFHDVKRFESSKSVTKSIGEEKKIAPRAFESFGKTHSDILLEKERRNDYSKRTSKVKNSTSNARLQGIPSVPNEDSNGSRDGGAKQNMEGLQKHNHKKKERNHRSSSDMRQPSVKSKGRGVSTSSKKMTSISSETREKVDLLQESDFDIDCKLCHSKPSNIMLLCPHEIPQSSSSEDFQLSESRTSSDEIFSESTQSCLSYVSLSEHVYTGDRCSEIPPSDSLRSAVDHSSLEKMQQSFSADLGIDRSSVVPETPSSIINKMSSLRSVGACLEKDMLETKLRDQFVFGKLKESLDQETAELTAQKEMSPSHNRRFSFSLSRIGRSFSFKEGPTLPQLSSMHVIAKSGPVTPQTSVRWDNPSKEANSHNRTRSSPLRRLLDPLLKHKASDKHHLAESSQTLEGTLNSSFRTISVNESLLAENSKQSTVQGLLQLTIKNGVPLFKFVLNNERKIFAATKNSLALLEKGDLGHCFTFYLVNEIKKKSVGWISHGNKEKNCGYAYNVVAQMNHCSSKITEPTNQNSNRKHMVKEYVLVGVEIGQTDEGQPKFIQSAELAAVVIEPSCEKGNERMHGDDNNMLMKGCSNCLADERCLCSSGQNDVTDCTTAIFPSGVHGSPNKGKPTTLIYRWKTGGSCDCGGWDIGCKLLVLSNQKQSSSIPKSYKPRFQLFVQEGAEQGTPLFTLLPLKDGFYSVEFASTITHLQAFFVSVAVLSCQSSLEMGGMHDEIIKEPNSNDDSKLQGKAPLKYAPMPPLSPVGRV
ncbi:hypothetical protein Fmac_012332 [Flemingia macrophylla]|uniref:DUF3527 domain protein n=1 Tax=Flemingia macrophylla TaxID=520843 RepID=A0ABD1MQ08_9FABA